ncbi:hypothetical protein DDI_1746 [Dickeya dianthicola RNS04.9]|nr:hypothetical protein DDI_1746 [Dickeya dianthicola RNS04.9]
MRFTDICPVPSTAPASFNEIQIMKYKKITDAILMRRLFQGAYFAPVSNQRQDL